MTYKTQEEQLQSTFNGLFSRHVWFNIFQMLSDCFNSCEEYEMKKGRGEEREIEQQKQEEEEHI